MFQVHQFTHLGRTIDPTYPTNLAISVLAVIAGVIGTAMGLSAGDGFIPALSVGFYSGFVTLVAWILARELDPDNDLSAFAAAIFSWAVALTLPENPTLTTPFLLIVLVRIVNRSVGLPLLLTDSLGAYALVALTVITDSWIFGLVAALAFYLDTVLNAPHPPHRIGIGVSLAALIASLIVNQGFGGSDLTLAGLAIAAVVLAGWLYTIVSMKTISALADATGEPMTLERQQAAMGIALLAGLVALWNGDSGIMGLSVLYTTLAAISVYRVMLRR